MIVTVPSHDVQVGDTVTFLGTPHLITSIEEHPSAISDTGTIRVASDDHGWGITIDGVICGRRIDQPTSVSDTLRWWLFHQSPLPITPETIIVWVRSDLAHGS